MVAKKKLKVIWDSEAKEQFREIYKYIKSESLQGANMVKDDILSYTKSLSTQPEIFEKDSLKISNDGTYRSFSVHNYRIAYRITADSVNILRIRHTSREPREY